MPSPLWLASDILILHSLPNQPHLHTTDSWSLYFHRVDKTRCIIVYPYCIIVKILLSVYPKLSWFHLSISGTNITTQTTGSPPRTLRTTNLSFPTLAKRSSNVLFAWSIFRWSMGSWRMYLVEKDSLDLFEAQMWVLWSNNMFLHVKDSLASKAWQTGRPPKPPSSNIQ